MEWTNLLTLQYKSGENRENRENIFAITEVFFMNMRGSILRIF